LKIGIAIIFFEKLNQTIDCIKSVLDSEYTIYVLNNNSSKKSFRSLRNEFKGFNQICYIDSKENLGPARGRNLLASAIEEEWILFLDNDITVETKNWNFILEKYIISSNGYNVFVPKLYNVHENKFLKYHTFKFDDKKIYGSYDESDIINWFPGGAACVNKNFFNSLNGYSEEISVLEDYELCIKSIFLKQPIFALLIDNLILFHDHKYSPKKEDQRATKIRYQSIKYQEAEDFINSKYDIEFYSGWRPWVDEQLGAMVDKDWITGIKEKLKGMLKHIKNKI
jgi:GT2 family glycosyltransferase